MAKSDAVRFRVTMSPMLFERFESLAKELELDVPTCVRLLATLQLRNYELARNREYVEAARQAVSEVPQPEFDVDQQPA